MVRELFNHTAYEDRKRPIPAVLDVDLRGKQDRFSRKVHGGHEREHHKEEFAAAIDDVFVPALCGLRVLGG
jgi:hypothetical protein